MKLHQNKKFIPLVIVALIAAMVQFNFSNENSQGVLAVSFCVTEKCKEAEEAERAATERANSASSAADTLEAEVARLEQEIKMYEARIAANEAIAEDLRNQIEENTAKLELQQQALANMLVNLHFEGQTDTIMILASSSSISDFAEKQSRADTAKTQVNLSAQTVKSLKEDLELQKAEVERIIADQELQRKAVQNTKKEQEELIAKYQANAEAYTAEAAAARKEKESEIAAEIARLNSSGVKGSGTNTYPFLGSCPRDNLRYGAYGGYVCQCTSYAGWKVYETWGVTISAWGNAKYWGNSAKNLGYRVDDQPEAGSVAFSTDGAYGHVMWVESVNSNGTINVSEYNNPTSSASGQWGDFGYRIGVNASVYRYIHFH